MYPKNIVYSVDDVTTEIIREIRQKFKNREDVFVVGYVGKDKKIHTIYGTVISLNDSEVAIQYSLSPKTITIPLMSIRNIDRMI